MRVEKSKVLKRDLNKFFIFFLLFGVVFFLNYVEAHPKFKNENITIWVRAFGEQAKKEIIPYIEYLKDELNSEFNLTLLIATNFNDPVDHILKSSAHINLVNMVYANMSSNHEGLNTLAGATEKSAYVLSLSLGVEIKKQQLVEALKYLQGYGEKEVFVYGWKIKEMDNDGSAPGLGWYNTAACYAPKCVNWMKEHPFPYWIDNGVEGELLVGNEKFSIGNNEEVVLMASILHTYPHAFFILNLKDSLKLSLQTGNGITFEEKLKRKVFVAKYYLETKFYNIQEEVWRHLWIISENHCLQKNSFAHILKVVD